MCSCPLENSKPYALGSHKSSLPRGGSKFGVGEQIPLGPIAVDGPGDAGKRADSERGTPGDLGKA